MAYGFIYLVRNLVNGKVYIGQTVRTIESRWIGHCADARGRRNYPLHSAIRKYGQDAFVVTELAHAESQDELNQMEADLVILHKSCDRAHGYNIRAGGDGGGRLSAETRRKISEKHTGRVAHNKGKPMSESCRLKLVERLRTNHPNTGKHLSEETKRKIGAANAIRSLGKKQSEETRRKHSEAFRRYYADPEARAKLSAKRMGHPVSEETRNKLSQAHKGRTILPEWRDKLRLANLGKKHSEETRRKMSESHLRRYANARSAKVATCP